MMGDTLKSQTGFSATLHAEVHGLDATRAARPGLLFVAVYRDALPVLTLPIPPSSDEFEFDLPTLGYARYRIQVQREGAIEAVSTPIWVEPVSGEPPPPTDCRDAPAIRLGDGDERFGGTPAPDRVAGRRGADRISGGDGDDCLSGGRGRDRLKGGAGEDELKGGGGSDRIKAQDGEADFVRCGKGHRDVARIDDSDEYDGCEKVVSALGAPTG
jgi:Ca2+-binding RTX toxin-like protein